MKLFRLALITVSVLTVAGCASKPSTEYLEQSAYTPIKAPAGTQAPMQQPLYAVPNIKTTNKPGNVLLIPPGSQIKQYQQQAATKK